MQRELVGGTSVYVRTQAKCTVYQATIESYRQFPFSENFNLAVDTLGTDVHAYYTFIHTFGTHYITELHMGAKSGYRTNILKSDYEKLHRMGIKAAPSASLSIGNKFPSATRLTVAADAY